MPLRIPYCPSILSVSKIINNYFLYPFRTTTSSWNIIQNLVCIFCFHFFEKTLAYHVVQAISKQQIILWSFFMLRWILIKNRFWCFALPFEMVSIIFCPSDILNWLTCIEAPGSRNILQFVDSISWRITFETLKNSFFRLEELLLAFSSFWIK